MGATGEFGVYRNEYLRQLPQCKGKGLTGTLKLGDVVLIREDNCLRLCGLLGSLLIALQVEIPLYGHTGFTQSTVRPIQRLYLLEMNFGFRFLSDGE